MKFIVEQKFFTELCDLELVTATKLRKIILEDLTDLTEE